MESYISILIFAASATLLSLAFIYSLISHVFRFVHSRETAEHHIAETELEDIVNCKNFGEVVSQGSVVPSFAAFAMLGMELANGHWYIWLALLAGIYILDFVIPEILSAMFPDTLSKFCVRAYRVIKYIFLPSAKIKLFLQNGFFKLLGYDSRLSFLSESMREAINDEDSPSALEEEERQMIRNIFVFGDTTVREIMTPRVEMHAVDVQTSLTDVIKLLNSERYSRLPVYSGTIDNIIGILSNREFLEWYTERSHETFDLKKLAHPALFVPTGKNIGSILHELRESNNHLVIVVDEYGCTAGLATMEDILEEIVGEIKDEDDSEEDMGFEKLPSGQYLLDPLITLSDLEDRLGIHFTIEESEHIETLSGLIQHTLGSLPKNGTSVHIQGYTFKVKKMDGTKMEEVVLETPLATDD
ncbi:MAG: hemolysin family protein [Candidatus Fibromonas sp.]|jgi:CBS domain containing-hemolysin-like protein|nr:hemolysin family protein [Candidatus Fibromonas sp.]